MIETVVRPNLRNLWQYPRDQPGEGGNPQEQGNTHGDMADGVGPFPGPKNSHTIATPPPVIHEHVSESKAQDPGRQYHPQSRGNMTYDCPEKVAERQMAQRQSLMLIG